MCVCVCEIIKLYLFVYYMFIPYLGAFGFGQNRCNFIRVELYFWVQLFARLVPELMSKMHVAWCIKKTAT